ncbi:MAG: hypothetical protein LC777_09910, partial [Actinobacteria bacterium]|nr:hypothetical protein [Actinomycetota bacterium]
GLGEVYIVMDDDDDDLYELAIEHFSDAIKLAESGTGSKRLTNGEYAEVLYSRGYARTALYEATGVAGLDRLLGKAEKDFKDGSLVMNVGEVRAGDSARRVRS